MGPQAKGKPASVLEELARLPRGGEPDFFLQLAGSLASLLGARTAIITRLDSATRPRVSTLAHWSDSGSARQFSYDLAGAPCERVFAERLFLVSDGVAEAFPNDLDLRKLSARSYVGVLLESRDGKPLGHLAALDSEPVRDASFCRAVATICAARAAAEIEIRALLVEG